jgi:DNA-binding transcriptional ArsR family regulator
MSTKTERQTERQKAAQNRIKAMNHPIRAAVLAILAERTSSPAEMARELDEDLSNVSYHTKQLVELECAELVSTRPVRGALEHFYRATERHQLHTDEWDELDPMMAENIVSEIMQKILDDFMSSARAKIVGADADFHLGRTPLLVDQEGLKEALEAHEKARLELLDIAARSAERMVESGEKGINVSSSQACFKMPSPKGRQSS